VQGQEEKGLIRRAKECDEAAWAEIYERHKQNIYRYIYYRVSNASLAEDLTQEVFLRALESIDSFAFRGIGLSSWLYRIARNLVIDHYRRQPERAELPLEEGLLAAAEEDLGRQQELREALDCLTDEQREVVILRFVNGLSTAEVAQVLDKSEGAVKSLQHRALAALGRILKGER